MAISSTPAVLIHGLWLHPTSWQNWFELLEEAGYEPVAPAAPGVPATVEESRRTPGAMAGYGIGDLVEHYAGVIEQLPADPVVIGHSTGGLVAQQLLARGLAGAAIAVDPAPIRGVRAMVPFASLRSLLPALRNPANRKRAVSLSSEQFRYAIGNALPADESDDLYFRWAIPGPARPVFELASANLNPRSPAAVDTRYPHRGPLLLISGGKDRLIPPALTRGTLKQYRASPGMVELMEFEDRGHSLVVDDGWRDVADAALSWLRKHLS